ncbi:hypothetical protein CIK05_13320 [Bdellovibrio sp. qaytius]|nr:hypothetical protein CIK05_13320 [Bdellovibrio sp. qaytius]
MKTLLLALMFNLAAVLFFSTAFASDAGGIASGGNGCPNGDIQVEQDELDPSSLVVRYSDQMQAGQDGARRLERKSCNLRIPLDVPQGMRLTVEVATVGYASVNEDRVSARQELFLAGAQGIVDDQQLSSGDFLLGIPVGQVVQTACGQSTILALNLNGTVLKKANSLTDSLLAIEKSVLHFTWEQCDHGDVGSILGLKLQSKK